MASDNVIGRNGRAVWKRRGRERVDKGSLVELDKRTTAAKRYRDLVAGFIADLGGAEQCSDIKVGLLRRLASVTIQAELLEARMISGENIDVTTLCTLASTTVRLSQRLGLERVARTVTDVDPLQYAKEAAE